MRLESRVPALLAVTLARGHALKSAAARIALLRNLGRAVAPRLETADALRLVEFCSPSLASILGRLRRVAPTSLSVLVVGETGTGKEVLARAIHAASQRPGRFVAENCAALPETLLEAELFGVRRGAFTGADASRHGLAVAADSGSLFLDEVGEMSERLQVKLLRMLQEREVRPVGASRAESFDARVLAGTNREASTGGRRFGLRPDLYYRLAQLRVTLPPLRSRRADIPWLSAVLLDRAQRARLGPGETLTPPALHRLMSLTFAGNVRELENVLYQACALARGPAIDAPLIDEVVEEQSIEIPERDMIREALERARGVKSAAARHLGWSRQRLYRRLEYFGLTET